MNKCDVCQKFGEMEEVQITIKKHKECDINGAFGKQEPKINLPLPIDLNQKPANSAVPYVNEELKKMIL